MIQQVQHTRDVFPPWDLAGCHETEPDSRFEMSITPITEECALLRPLKVLTSV